MKWLLLGLAFLCLGCSGYKRVLKSWNKIQREIALNPGLADSLNLIDRDTIRTERVIDSLVYLPVIDSALVDSLALVLCETLKNPDKTSDRIIPAIRKKLATSGCPEVETDTTYMVKINYKGVTAEIPVRLSARLHNGELKLNILASEIEIPTEHRKLNLEFKNTTIPLIKNPWFWSTLGIILVLILLIIWTLLRK